MTLAVAAFLEHSPVPHQCGDLPTHFRVPEADLVGIPALPPGAVPPASSLSFFICKMGIRTGSFEDGVKQSSERTWWRGCSKWAGPCGFSDVR